MLHLNSPHIRPRCLPLFLVLFFLFACNAMIVKDMEFSVSTQDRFTSLFSFVFDVGGSLDLSLTISPYITQPVQVMFCTDKELEPLRNAYMTFEAVCHELPLGLCGKEYTINPASSLPEEEPTYSITEYDNIHRIATTSVISLSPGAVPVTTVSRGNYTTVFDKVPFVPRPRLTSASVAPLASLISAFSTAMGEGAVDASEVHSLASDSFQAALDVEDSARSHTADLAAINLKSASVASATDAVFSVRPAAAAAPHAAAAADITISYTDTIPVSDRYRLLQLNCEEIEYRGVLSYTAMNPGGEYLSLTFVPYKSMFKYVGLGFSLFLLVWGWHVFMHRSLNIQAQTVLFAVPFCKALLALVYDNYWNTASVTGVAPSGLYWVSFILSLANRALIFTTVLVLATGYGVLAPRVARVFSSRIVTLVSFYTLAYALYQMDFAMALLLMIVNYAFIWQLFSLFIAITLRDVGVQIDALQRHQINYILTPLYPKIDLIRRLQPAFIAYILADLISSMWASMVAASAPWIQDAVEHCAAMLMMLMLARALWLHPFNPHLYSLALLNTTALPTNIYTAISQELAARITPATHGYHHHSDYRIHQLLPDTQVTNEMMYRPGKPYPSPLTAELLRHLSPDPHGQGRFGHCLVHSACRCSPPDGSETDSAFGPPPAYSPPATHLSAQTQGSSQAGAQYFRTDCCAHIGVAMLYSKVAPSGLLAGHMAAVSEHRVSAPSAGQAGAGAGMGGSIGVGVDARGYVQATSSYQGEPVGAPGYDASALRERGRAENKSPSVMTPGGLFGSAGSQYKRLEEE